MKVTFTYEYSPTFYSQFRWGSDNVLNIKGERFHLAPGDRVQIPIPDGTVVDLGVALVTASVGEPTVTGNVFLNHIVYECEPYEPEPKRTVRKKATASKPAA